MARLNIPERHREGISQLLSLAPEAFNELLAALETQPPSISLITRLPTTINISTISSVDVERMVSAVTSLHLVRASKDRPSNDFVQDVSQAIESFDPIGQSEESKARLLRIINIYPLVISAKAFTILMDRERTMLTAKILTDIRYAFQPDPEQTPYGAVIIHTLKLSYHEGERHQDFLVALDDADIATLKVILSRAEAKAKVLRSQLNATNVIDLSKEE